MASTDNTLRRYRSKRNFSITSEPAEGGEVAPDALKFVVQKHWASRLHYDFRLELDGTMKSWAIPKGPSFDPKDKRMAVHVEDHPIAYASFEGTIPPKQYGAGRVIIWDTGTWCPIGDPRAGYRGGHLKFVLRGYKLHGRWLLVRMKGKSQKQEPWLLIKENDEFVRPASEFSVVDEFPESVNSLPAPAGTSTGLPSEATPCDLPPKLAPQLATLVAAPPPDPHNWVYEIKFDGYRLLTRVDGVDIKLFTRNGNDWTDRLAPLRKAIVKLKLPSGWYVGEIVLPNENGLPDFGTLQLTFDSVKTRNIVLYLFDVPFFAGHDMRAVLLNARRAILKDILEEISLSHPRSSYSPLSVPAAAGA